jgi:hypothetical protein
MPVGVFRLADDEVDIVTGSSTVKTGKPSVR